MRKWEPVSPAFFPPLNHGDKVRAISSDGYEGGVTFQASPDEYWFRDGKGKEVVIAFVMISDVQNEADWRD